MVSLEQAEAKGRSTEIGRQAANKAHHPTQPDQQAEIVLFAKENQLGNTKLQNFFKLLWHLCFKVL